MTAGFTLPPPAVRTIELRDEAATLALGGALAHTLQPGLRIYLTGDLGAGKTTLVRGLLRELGYAGRVKSPTYTLLESYNVSSLYLYHFDFYRFANADDWRDAGFVDEFGGSGVCLVEWPERAGSALPAPDVTIELCGTPHGGRVAQIRALSEPGARCLACLKFQPAAAASGQPGPEA
jgi:tRNA threonylcarbamoyladenosine biosynthesis protein TsaE